MPAKKIDLGGKGQEWSFTLSISNRDSRWMNLNFYFFRFKTDDVKEAMSIILSQTQKILKRFKVVQGKRILIQAAPFLSNKPKVLDADKMIRNKMRYHSSAILRIKNPDLALVQGYGPDAAEKISD